MEVAVEAVTLPDGNPLIVRIDTREGALQAARDFFYKGEIAQEIVDWVQGQGGLLTMEDLAEFSLEELQQFSEVIAEDVFEVLTLEGSVAARNHIGGTAPQQVRAAVQRARTLIE